MSDNTDQIIKTKKKRSKSTANSDAIFIGGGANSNFDAANYSRFRSFLPSVNYTQQEGGEVTRAARNELNRRAGVLFNNSPSIKHLHEFLSRHVVGIGLFPIAMTSDEAWNAKAERYFENWANNKFYCDAKNQKTFWGYQRKLITDMFRAGETFIKKSYDFNGRPKLQAFGSHEIGNVGKDDCVDGILLDNLGAVTGYRVLTGGESYVDVPAYSMMHIANLERDDGQLRSPTIMYAGLNPAQDLLEASASEKVRHKLQSMLTAVVKRQGQNNAVNKSLSDVVTKVSADKITGVNATTGATQVETGVRQLIESIGGFGALAYLGIGEELQFLRVEGNDAFVGLQQLLIYEIAWSIGINPEIAFYLSKLGGTASRAALADLAGALSVLQDRINEQFNTPTWVWVIGTAMARGELPMCNDQEWWRVAWQGPPKMSVDIGREGTLYINLRNAGMLTLAQYWGAQGLGWRESVSQIAREIRAEKLACWEASDHAEGETPNITVDYYNDYRVIAGRTTDPNILDKIDSEDFSVDGNTTQTT